MERSTAFFIGGMFVLVLALGVFLPGNTVTGNTVKDTCSGCLELCEQGGSCTQKGMTCCFTHWESGVCSYESDCERIREYSLYQTLEVYQDTIREQAPAVQASWARFFFPLILTIACIAYFVRKK